MDKNEALLVLGLDENFTEDQVEKSYESLWRKYETQRVLTTKEIEIEINELLGKLNRARTVLIDFLYPGRVR